MIALPVTANLRRPRLGQSQVKTTLAGTGTASAPNSAAHREANPLPSGGSELIFDLPADAKPALLTTAFMRDHYKH